MMSDDKLSPEAHREQIEAFRKLRPAYEVYARVLERALQEACRTAFPSALIQARAKTVSSFAEKAARKFPKYRNAVHELTDLCGARVIVQTGEQVRAVQQFIRQNFRIVEEEDKEGLLRQDEFGYRDLHYLVRLSPPAETSLKVSQRDRRTIGDRVAEIQVRTWLQHAWADTLHDRIYKNELPLSRSILRSGALLAALMEEGDRGFHELADQLDGLIANYTAYAGRKDVEREIGTLEMILGSENDEFRRRGLSLKLAQLASACGDDRRAISVLQPLADTDGPYRAEILLELGHRLCGTTLPTRSSRKYKKGLRYLEEAVESAMNAGSSYVVDLRRKSSLGARALSRLGQALSEIEGSEPRARACLQEAHECEPRNPYYLSDMLGFEAYCTRSTEQPASMRTTIREGIRTCNEHAASGLELPYACFTSGRLSMLLNGIDDGLNYYARGIHYCRDNQSCVPAKVMAAEIRWLEHIHFGRELPPEYQYAIDILALGQSDQKKRTKSRSRGLLAPPVLIVAGGAASIDRATVARLRPLVRAALEEFSGTVIFGGTTTGIPGCVGDIAAELDQTGQRRFQLIGYLPRRLTAGIERHPASDRNIQEGTRFAPAQIIRNWADILSSGLGGTRVHLLGFGGGPLSAFEYRMALAMGASVGVVRGTGGAADGICADPLWAGAGNLYPLPLDTATVKAFTAPGSRDHDDTPDLEQMARAFHNRFVASSSNRLPDNMKPWDQLSSTFRQANLEQARRAIEILRAAGFGVRRAHGSPTILDDMTGREVERMAELEHGRWNVERLRDGWRPGEVRDDERKIHNCIVPWKLLPDDIRHYDRDAVQAYPDVLARAGLEIYRLRKSTGRTVRS